MKPYSNSTGRTPANKPSTTFCLFAARLFVVAIIMLAAAPTFGQEISRAGSGDRLAKYCNR